MWTPKHDHLLPSKRLNKRLRRRKTVFFSIVRPINNRKVVDRNWHTEYSNLKNKGRYFFPRFKRFKHHWQKNWKEKRKSPFKEHSSREINLRLKPKVKKIKVLRSAKKKMLKASSFNRKKTHTQKKIKILKRKFFIKSKKRAFKRKYKFKKYEFKPLQPRRFLKIMRRYLKKKRNKVLIIKKQRYLSLILDMKKRVSLNSSFRPRSVGIWKFLQQEAFKKRFSFKKESFLNVFDQGLLWKKIHKFLIYNKLLKMQKKLFFRYPKLRLHTDYKNYYGTRLRQPKQVTRFSSYFHTFRKVFKYRTYKTRLAERQYYHAHPAEWKAEKARRYRARQFSQKPSKKNKWAQWTKKNVSPSGLKPYGGSIEVSKGHGQKSTMKHEHSSSTKKGGSNKQEINLRLTTEKTQSKNKAKLKAKSKDLFEKKNF